MKGLWNAAKVLLMIAAVAITADSQTPAASQASATSQGPVTSGKPSSTLPRSQASVEKWQGAFTFTHYDLEATITPSQGALAVRGRITLRNDSAIPQSKAELQISSALKWVSVRLVAAAGGAQPLNFSVNPVASDIDHTGIVNMAVFALPQAVPAGDNVRLEIGYDGVIATNSGRLQQMGAPASVANRSDWDHIGSDFSGVRGVGSVAWYPVDVEPATLAQGNKLFTVLGNWKAREAEAVVRVKFRLLDIHLPDQGETGQLSLLADGQRSLKPENNAGDEVEYTYAPLGYRVPTFVVGDYRALKTSAAVIHYVAGHQTQATQYGNLANSLLPLEGEWFGQQKVPLEIVELPDSQTAAFESQATFFTPLQPAPAAAETVALAHPLAHSFVSPTRLWIYEGLAHFAQVLEREQQQGRQAALDYMNTHRSALALAEPGSEAAASNFAGDASISASHSLIQTHDEIFYRTKAMFVWWMLRDMLGDAALQRALQAYRPEQDREPSNMQRLLETESRQKLESFFDDWVYRDRGLPEFRVNSVFTRATLGGLTLVTGNLENLGVAEADVPVIVHEEVRGEPKEDTGRIVIPGHGKAVIRIEVHGIPRELQVNDGSVPELSSSHATAEIKGGK